MTFFTRAGMGFQQFYLGTGRGMDRAAACDTTTHFLPHPSISTVGLIALLLQYSDAVADLQGRWKPILAEQNLEAISQGIACNNNGFAVPIVAGDMWKCSWPAGYGPAAFTLQALAYCCFKCAGQLLYVHICKLILVLRSRSPVMARSVWWRCSSMQTPSWM